MNNIKDQQNINDYFFKLLIDAELNNRTLYE